MADRRRPRRRRITATAAHYAAQRGTTMSRTLAFIAVLASCIALTAPLCAQEQPPGAGDARFAFHRSDGGGYLRLDLHTGEVAACSQSAGAWACALVGDERTAFESEIARLRRDNAMLKNALLAHGVPLPGSMTADAAPTAPPRSATPVPPALPQAVPPAASAPPVPPQTVPPTAPPKAGESDRASREDAELERIMNTMEKVWRRLVEMMMNIQRDIQKKS
jgi:hypothetical protein